jgi:hypothetical protein
MAEFEEMYQDAPSEVVTETVTEDPPAGYAPLSTKNRQDWNNFVRYVNRDLKVGGSKELDERSSAKGLELLDQYRKDHPGFTLTRDMVPYVQYEFQQLKNTGTLPGLDPSKRVRALVDDYFSSRNVSPVDGWIGSLTSRQGYPEVAEFDDDPNKKYWGLDYEGASQFERENWRPPNSRDRMVRTRQ